MNVINISTISTNISTNAAGLFSGSGAIKHLALDNLPFNWFDAVVVIVLVVGVRRGQKRGMSEELLPLLQWLALVFLCGFFCEPVGRAIAGSSDLGLLISRILAYLGLAIGITIIFSFIKRLVGGKLMGSDVFGRGEYYLAMPAGMVRFACILVSILALLNARYYSPEEIAKANQYQKENFNSDLFPTLQTAQYTIFEKSLAGPFIKQYLGFLLIKPTPIQQDKPKPSELDHMDMHKR